MDTERLAAAIEAIGPRLERLAAAIEQGNALQTVPGRATGGSERTNGTEVANDRSVVSSVVTLHQENNRSFVRNDRTDERTRFSWQDLTTDEMTHEEVTRSKGLTVTCNRIAEIVIAKPGRWWRQDRMLHVVAAVLASRIDRVSRSEIGTEWLNTALQEVHDFRPENSAAYFQDALKRGLGRLDPVFRDESTARMAWIQLCQTVRVPEVWLEEKQPREMRIADRSA